MASDNVVGGPEKVFIPLWIWPVFLVSLVVALSIDFALQYKSRMDATKSSVLQTIAWISLGFILWQVLRVGFGAEAGKQYIAGYLIEKGLSFDNVFVWALIFKAFLIDRKYQRRVLFWGIFGALSLRALSIFVGLALIDLFHVTLLFMGGFLVWTAIKMAFGHDAFDPHKSRAVQKFKQWVPTVEHMTKDELEKQRLFVRRGGKRYATPLMTVLVVIEVSDVFFAFDSVPAILAISDQRFIVFASNAMAILGLRSMYSLLAELQDRFEYLDKGLSFILAFVGGKMVAGYFGRHLDTWWSLGIILLILVVAILASLVKHYLEDRPSPTVPVIAAEEPSVR